ALAGDRGQALGVFTAFAARIQRDLGAEPDVETRALADRIRQGRVWRLPETVQAAPTGAESRPAPLVGRPAGPGRPVTTWAAGQCAARGAGARVFRGAARRRGRAARDGRGGRRALARSRVAPGPGGGGARPRSLPRVAAHHRCAAPPAGRAR